MGLDGLGGPLDGLPYGPGCGFPSTPPPGWKCTIPKIGNAVVHAGSWHNTFPGDLRVHVDPTNMLTFFDLTFTLRIQSRRALTREQYRLQNVSSADIGRAREDIAQLFSRPRMSEAACQTSWPSRRQCRIAVRQQFIISLIPYMPRAGVGEPAWFAETAQRCRASFTGHLPVLRFTKQEHVLHNALDKVLQEVCRVLTSAWSETFDVEDKSVEVAAELLVKWKDEVDALV